MSVEFAAPPFLLRRLRYFLVVVATLASTSPLAAQDGDTPGTVSQARLHEHQQQVFRAALRAVRPSIVRIDTIGGLQPEQRAPVGGRRAGAGFRQADGPTTGLIWSADGYVITSSFNFIRDPSIITVTLHDGRRFVARLIARDRPARLALLNALLLYRGLLRDGVLRHSDGWQRLLLQVIVANAVMWVALDWIQRPLSWWLEVGTVDRAIWLGVSVVAGVGAYAVVLLALGLRPSKLGIRPH